MSPPATALSSSRTSLTSGSSQRRRHRRCSSPRPTCAGSRAAPRRRRRGASPPPSGRRGSSWVPPSPPWRRATAPASTTLRCGGRSARPAGWWCRSTRAPSTRGTWSPPFTTGSVRRAPCRGSLHGARCMPGRCSGSRRRRRSCPRLPRRGSTAAGRGPRRCSSSTRGPLRLWDAAARRSLGVPPPDWQEVRWLDGLCEEGGGRGGPRGGVQRRSTAAAPA
mmetsp:Transcript_26956/g.88120  ORF Transcript_26956/g.88120 Transcript_26956/m.88120 type:complete len:221 (+) Transcript_26956:262-924(+)